MLEHLLDLASRNHVDLTGYNQHGYKKDSSAVPTALKLQSIIYGGYMNQASCIATHTEGPA